MPEKKVTARGDTGTPPATPSFEAALARLANRLNTLLDRVEPLLPPLPLVTDWEVPAFRWRRGLQGGELLAIPAPHPIHLADLHGIDEQKARLVANTRQFVAGRPANNVLLTGARGTGKSSLIKALLHEFAPHGLRVIEVDKSELIDLPQITARIAGRRERFVVFCDDLSFDAGDATYKALKVALDGSLEAPPENLLIYATSNRRHLMPEFHSENRETVHKDGEVHPGEATEEKISLSERFGLWLSFYPFDQDHYLAIASHWRVQFGLPPIRGEAEARDALNWALMRGSRSGRVAWQYAKDAAGMSASTRRKSP